MILAIDQGTTGSTAIVFDERDRPVGRSYAELRQHFPRPGWVEHDPEDLWRSAQRVAKEALDAAGIDGRRLSAVGITNQRETVVAWDRQTGEPLHRALVWQDRRTSRRCDELREGGHEPLVRERTGLVLDPYFSATKIEWLISHGDVDPAKARFGTVDAWLVHKLCGVHATDHSNASRTMLFDTASMGWDEELCELFGVPVDSLPEPQPSISIFGETEVFGGRVPVAGIAGDQQAALYGQGCHAPGLGKNTYGTGSFVLQNAGTERPPAPDGLLSTVAAGAADGPNYAIEAAIFVTGAAVQWLRDGLGIIRSAGETEELARSLDSNDGVYLVPAFAGLGSPHWDPYARGTIVGLTRGSGRAQLARAVLESIAYQAVDAIRAMENASGVELTELKADGGAVHNSWLMRFQADVLGVPVVVPEVSETTALGAAYLAGVSVGLWSEEDTRAMWREAARYEPRMAAGERERLLASWNDAVGRAGGWARNAAEGDG